MNSYSSSNQGGAGLQLSPSPFIAYEILALDQPDAAAKSHAAQHAVLWISSQPPQKVLGALGQLFEGAWYEPGKVVVSLHGRKLVYQVTPPPAAELHALLKSTLEMHLKGVSPNAIQNKLSHSNLQPVFA